MKKLILILSLLSAQLWAGPLHKLHFTKTDFGVYECLTTSPACENSAYLGQTTTLLANSQTNYAGHSYAIDHFLDYLVVDGTYAYPLFLDILLHFGFCIDNAGQGWLLSATFDGDPNLYLYKVNLSNGVCTFIDHVDFGVPDWPTGMYMIEP